MFFGGVFLSALALYLLAHALKSLRQLDVSAAWEAAEGRITSAEFTAPVAGSSGWHSFMPEYTFDVGGQRYTGRRVALYTIAGQAEVQALRERYPVGAAVTVHYDPSDPNEAVLIKAPPPGGKRYSDVVLAGLALAVGLALMVFSQM
ncbi:MAG: DUF3592 domain-containing protein [Pseudomonadota bacterium]